MSASVFAFPRREKGPQPWTNDELAELYRVVDLLGRAGLAVITDMGMSDEGDPWFVFCRTDNGEVIAHFARIDGVFVAASIAVDETFRGANFRQIVDRMVSSQPLVVPPPTSGSRLFLHPAVLLTAFVATALAHSEKMMVQDWLRSVEAVWDHSKSGVLEELRQLKTGWHDTLQTLARLPLQEIKILTEGGKDSQHLALASLIAIAMTALQPIADKVAALTHVINSELSGHAAESGAQGFSAHARHVADAMLSFVTDGDKGSGDGHAADGNTHGGTDAPQLAKTAAAAWDASSDSQKAIIDSAHMAAVQKVALPVEESHAAAPASALQTAETQADINSAFILMQQQQQQQLQKVAAAAAQPVESFTVHIDSGLVFFQTIAVQDVTPEARTFLSLGDPSKSTSGTADGQTPPPTSSTPSGDATGDHTTTSPTLGNTSSEPPSVVGGGSTSQAPAPFTGSDFYVSANNGALLIQAISDFANNADHLVNPKAISISAGLTAELQNYFGSETSLRLVFFESTAADAPDVLLAAPGVVFVNEKEVSPLAHLVNPGGSLTIHEPNSVFVTLVGVATIEHGVSV